MGALSRDTVDAWLTYLFIYSFHVALSTRVRLANDRSSHICKELTIHIAQYSQVDFYRH